MYGVERGGLRRAQDLIINQQNERIRPLGLCPPGIKEELKEKKKFGGGRRGA